jgi:hypothetical protein
MPGKLKEPRDDTPLATDVIWGAAGIGQFLGLTARQVFQRAAAGTLPIGKTGRGLFSTRSRLREHLAGQLGHRRAARS